MSPVAILSPHFDDAVLSCFAVLASPDDVVVLNVFAGAPPPGTRPGWWDHHLGSPEAALRTRAGEDRRALAHAGREARNLDFVDAQYRPDRAQAGPLVPALDEALPADATVWAPASLGLHPDHEAVREAALELWRGGRAVVLYADLPHASLRGWPEWVAHDGHEEAGRSWDRTLECVGLPPDSLARWVTRLDDDLIRRKLEAVREYASQLPGFAAMYDAPLDQGELLDYEVAWALPPASAESSSAVASARKPAAS